jgi:hypothetical protein
MSTRLRTMSSLSWDFISSKTSTALYVWIFALCFYILGVRPNNISVWTPQTEKTAFCSILTHSTRDRDRYQTDNQHKCCYMFKRLNMGKEVKAHFPTPKWRNL